MAQQTVGKLNLQLSASADALQQDLAKGSKNVEQFAEKTTKTVGKGIELKADTFSKLGLMASGGAILNELKRGNDALSETVDLTSQLALGWAVGGPIGAGIAGAIAGLRKFMETGKGELPVIGKFGAFSTDEWKQFIAGKGKSIEPLSKADAAKMPVLGKATSELDKQIKSLRAGTAEEAELIQILGSAAEGGGKRVNALVAEVRSLYATYKELSAQKAAEQKLADVDTLLQRQIDTFGKTAAEVRAYEVGLAKFAQVTVDAADPVERLGQQIRNLANAHHEQELKTKLASVAAKEMQLTQMKLAQDGQQFIDNLRMEVMTFGMAAKEAELFKLSLRGLSEEDQLRAKRLIDHTEKQKAWQAAMASGKQVFEETRTPLEKFNARLSELQDLVRQGGIRDWDTYGRAVLGAWQNVAGMNAELMKVPELRSTPFAGAEAQRLFEREKQNRPEEVAKRGNQNPVVQVLNKQLQIQQQQRQELQQLNQELRQRGVDIFRL